MILDPRRFKDFGLINKCVCFANICQQISNIREIQWYFVTFENDHVFSSDLISSHVTLRHWSIKVLSLMGGSLFCTFFKKVEKSCPKCFKKRFKSRSRWRLILGLNPSFGGFFSQNFQKLKITKFKTPGRKRTRGHVRSHPQKSIIFGRREGGRRTWVFIAPSKNGALRAIKVMFDIFWREFIVGIIEVFKNIFRRELPSFFFKTVFETSKTLNIVSSF